MFRDVITACTTREQWNGIRAEIHERVLKSMGNFPELETPAAFEFVSEHSHDGLHIREFRFQSLPGYTTYGSIVTPVPNGMVGAGVICCHGTDYRLAHRNVLSSTEKPNRQYALELAHRGIVTLAVDQFGFGKGNAGCSPEEITASFYKQYPDWSLDGVRLWIHQRAVDLFSQVAGDELSRIGCIGNSLGGRAAVYLAAFDERVTACVASTGLSPNLTNVFRNIPSPSSLSPKLDEEVGRTGVPPFEYQEMLSLIAPRGILLLEPWNDPCNPMIESVLRCFEKARFVFKLSDVPEQIQILCHGDGHDTTPTVRKYAYEWLLDRLNPNEKNLPTNSAESKSRRK